MLWVLECSSLTVILPVFSQRLTELIYWKRHFHLVFISRIPFISNLCGQKRWYNIYHLWLFLVSLLRAILKGKGVDYSFRDLLYTIKSGRSVVGYSDMKYSRISNFMWIVRSRWMMNCRKSSESWKSRYWGMIWSWNLTPTVWNNYNSADFGWFSFSFFRCEGIIEWWRMFFNVSKLR